MDAYKRVGGGGRRWTKSYTSKWLMKFRDKIRGLYWLLRGLI